MHERKAMLKVDARCRITKTLQEYRCLSHQVEVNIIYLQCNSNKKYYEENIKHFIPNDNISKCEKV